MTVWETFQDAIVNQDDEALIEAARSALANEDGSVPGVAMAFVRDLLASQQALAEGTDDPALVRGDKEHLKSFRTYWAKASQYVTNPSPNRRSHDLARMIL